MTQPRIRILWSMPLIFSATRLLTCFFGTPLFRGGIERRMCQRRTDDMRSTSAMWSYCLSLYMFQVTMLLTTRYLVRAGRHLSDFLNNYSLFMHFSPYYMYRFCTPCCLPFDLGCHKLHYQLYRMVLLFVLVLLYFFYFKKYILYSSWLLQLSEVKVPHLSD